MAIGGNVISFGRTLKNIYPQSATSRTEDYNTLILRCSTDKEALEELYNLLKKNVYATAYSVLKDHHLSEDCVVETFIRLAKVKNFNAEGGDGKGFILKIARNTALEHYRKQKREFSNGAHEGCSDTLEYNAANSDYVNYLLKGLNNKQREVVIMKCYNGMTFEEIGKLLKTPVTTIKSRYSKAMEILRKKAGEENEQI